MLLPQNRSVYRNLPLIYQPRANYHPPLPLSLPPTSPSSMATSSPSHPNSPALPAQKSTPPASISSPASSMPMSTSTSPAAPPGRASPPAPVPSRLVALLPSSICPSTPTLQRWIPKASISNWRPHRPVPLSISLSGAVWSPATSTGSTNWPPAASSASKHLCPTAVSRISRPPTTSPSMKAWHAPPNSAASSLYTPKMIRSPLPWPAALSTRDEPVCATTSLRAPSSPSLRPSNAPFSSPKRPAAISISSMSALVAA